MEIHDQGTRCIIGSRTVESGTNRRVPARYRDFANFRNRGGRRLKLQTLLGIDAALFLGRQPGRQIGGLRERADGLGVVAHACFCRLWRLGRESELEDR